MNNVVDSLNIFSLFSGSGMLDEAVGCALSVLGYGHRMVGYAERECSAAALLLAGMEKQRLSRAPVWCDEIATLDARPLRGFVDLLTASPPCQPYSLAGKGKGIDDPRSYGRDAKRPKGIISRKRWKRIRSSAEYKAQTEAPLPHTIRIIDESRPAVVYFENVREWVTGGAFQRFGEELCAVGYTIEDPIFIAAQDVGAPHIRERVFIMAYSECARRRITESLSVRQPRQNETAPVTGRPGQELGNAGHNEPHGGHVTEGGEGGGMFPPGRNEYRRWAELIAAGLDATNAPAIESGFSVVADGVAPSSELLRIGGNGVVPLQAAVAFCVLWSRTMGRLEKSD